MAIPLPLRSNSERKTSLDTLDLPPETCPGCLLTSTQFRALQPTLTSSEFQERFRHVISYQKYFLSSVYLVMSKRFCDVSVDTSDIKYT